MTKKGILYFAILLWRTNFQKGSTKRKKKKKKEKKKGGGGKQLLSLLPQCSLVWFILGVTVRALALDTQKLTHAVMKTISHVFTNTTHAKGIDRNNFAQNIISSMGRLPGYKRYIWEGERQ